MIDSAPGWAETTVKWLELNQSVYVRESRGKSSTGRLMMALRKAGYRDADSEAMALSDTHMNAVCKKLADDWTLANHNHLVEWFRLGGYPAYSLRVDMAKSEKVKKDRASFDSVAVMGIDGVAAEEIKLIMDENFTDDDVEAIVKVLKPASETSSENELANVLAEQEFKEDERHETW
jgi:hypothetical protein